MQLRSLLLLLITLNALPQLARAQAAEQQCPKTEAEWQGWMTETANQIVPLPKDPRKMRYPEFTIPKLNEIARCEKDWEAKKGREAAKQVAGCTDRVKRYLSRTLNFKETPLDDLANGIHGMLPQKLKHLVSRRSKSLGFNVTDQEYYRAVDRYVSIPTELQNPEFLKNVSHPLENDGLKKARAYLDELNQTRLKNKEEPIVHFHFQTNLGNRESSQKKNAGRLFVRFPGNPNKYIQFATHEKEGGSSQTSVVGIYTDAKGTPHTYIKDHLRDLSSDSDVKLLHVEEGVFKGNACINCHQSGPRALNPKNFDKLDKETQQKITKLKAEFAAMESMEWGGFYDTASMDFGPPLGDEMKMVPEKRSDLFFEQCTQGPLKNAKVTEDEAEAEAFSKNKTTTYAKLRKAMNCTSCHDGQDQGPIKLPFDANHVFGRVSSGGMPPGNKFNSFERSLLNACLEAEFFGYERSKESGETEKVPGTVVNYLTGVPCESTSAPRPLKARQKLSSDKDTH